MSALDSYDGLPKVFMPDDLHIVLSGAALDSLIAACLKAKRDGSGLALGPLVDGEPRAIILTRLEPTVARNPLLATVPVPSFYTPPPRQTQPEPARVPQLAGVLADYG